MLWVLPSLFLSSVIGMGLVRLHGASIAAVLLPAALAVLLQAGQIALSDRTGEEDDGRGRYLCITGALLILTGCLMTEMAPLFLMGFLLLGLILLWIRAGKNRPPLLKKLSVSILIPSAVYLILMFILLLPHLIRTFGGYH